MNRKQFMEQLERLLSDISEAERQEALEYYEGYFDIRSLCIPRNLHCSPEDLP